MGLSRSCLDRGVGRHLGRLFSSGTVTGLTEGQLLDRFATSRDESAFEALVERHGPMVLGVCRQLLRDPNDVDDAFQATFLVLVRKAGTLRQKELLGNWLYGVAYRVALRARSLEAGRTCQGAWHVDVNNLGDNSGSEHSETVCDSVVRSEQFPLIHEEVNRLPQKYRSPVLLCYFEGLTHDEAAVKLGWPVGTVKGRLARARDLLRGRLSRRGVTVASAALAAHLGSVSLRACVPTSLTHSTLEAALAVASGSSAALSASSAVSLSVASLTQGVIKAMVISQFKPIVVSTVVVTGLLTAGASVAAFQARAGFRGQSGRKSPQVSSPCLGSQEHDPNIGYVAGRTGRGSTRTTDHRRYGEACRRG